ncbi:MAG TPA: alanine racemase [Steroidobacteraceae bacterium]|nr:alanine racemase [Steroidobacteraceae bacterium]
MIAGPRARVRLDSLRHNLATVRRAAPGARVLAVVKANAYGHGLVPVARALERSDGLAVARLGEALALRQAGVGGTVVVLEGAFSSEELDAAANHGLDLVVHAWWQIELLEAFAQRDRFRVWLKLDTGMNRLGFRGEEAAAALERIRACPAIRDRPKLMTHLAVADETGHPGTRRQLDRFAALVAADPQCERSIANSAGVLAWPQAHGDWVRPGIMLYGISPFAGQTGTELGLEPAMTLETSVIALRELTAGETVGYGATWRAPRDCRVAIAAIGYADGYPRHLPNGSPAAIRGRIVPLAGRVSMDMIALDVTTVTGVAVGDTVELWGRGVAVEQVATAAGTIPYELVCGISQRVAISWE